MKNEKRTVSHFPFSHENVGTKNSKQKSIKYEHGSLVSYLNFVFHIEVKIKPIIEFRISFFNLSETRNGTLGTRIREDFTFNKFVNFLI